MIQIFLCSLVLVLPLVQSVADKTEVATKRPNVVIILCDDLGYGDLACQGHPTIQTPSIDRFANEGTRFTAMYAAAPMCSPSRAGLLTGRSPHRCGIYDWIPHDGSSTVHLGRDEFTLAQGLGSVGYQCSLFGKWHLNSAFNSPSQPQPDDHGFEHWFATQFSPSHKNPVGFVENGRALPQLQGDACQLVVDAAIDWLRTKRDPSRPFFQFVSFHEPHHPIVPPAELVAQYQELARNKEEATYFASVHNLDLATGRYLKALDKLDLADDTIVIFTSDHGPQRRGRGVFKHSHGRSDPYRGTKRTLLEGGLRVPCFVRWPKHISARASIDTAVGFVDILPTLSSTCKFDLPSRKLDGEDVSSLLSGKGKFERQKPLHWHFYAPIEGAQSVMRSGRWTLTAQWNVDASSFRGGARRIPEHEGAIRKATLQGFHLYDTSSDPKQLLDLSAEHPQVLAKLVPQLRALHAEVRDDAKQWSQEEPLEKRPNILFIVSEDNGPELGCYGDPYVQTPTLDALASSGVRFDRAFVPYSVCSPSRACFLTGLYPQQNGQLGLATHKFALYESTPSMPSFLKARGYRTGIIGKLHVNPERNFAWDYRAIRSANFGKRNMAEYSAKAREFFMRSRGPWFLQINYPDAHFPLHNQQFGLPQAPLEGKDVKPLPFIGADSERLREFTANYYNCLSRLDSGVKMLLDVLDESGQRENTMIIYIGDHGAQFSRAKCSVYEAGLRIPMIVNWPGHTKAGRVRNELVSTLDILPTILHAADISAQSYLPGKSLIPLLKGKRVKWRKHIFGITTGSAPGIDYLQFSVRDDRWKLIWNPEAGRANPFATAYREHRNAHFLGGTTAEEISAATEQVQEAYAVFQQPPEFELYDLKADPHEFENLAGDAKLHDLREGLLAELRAWQARIRDPLSNKVERQHFIDEQAKHRDGSHRKKGFVWPYVGRFRDWRAKRSNKGD